MKGTEMIDLPDIREKAALHMRTAPTQAERDAAQAVYLQALNTEALRAIAAHLATIAATLRDGQIALLDGENTVNALHEIKKAMEK